MSIRRGGQTSQISIDLLKFLNDLWNILLSFTSQPRQGGQDDSKDLALTRAPENIFILYSMSWDPKILSSTPDHNLFGSFIQLNAFSMLYQQQIFHILVWWIYDSKAILMHRNVCHVSGFISSVIRRGSRCLLPPSCYATWCWDTEAWVSLWGAWSVDGTRR